MTRTITGLTLILGLLAASCGDSADVTAGADDGTVFDDSVSDDSVSDDPVDSDPNPDDIILGAGPYPIADLRFVVQIDGPDSEVVTYRLSCLGDTATLSGEGAPNSAAEMCLAVAQEDLRDRLVDGASADQICTEIYGGPEIATVAGNIDGDTVDTDFHRNNGCGISGWDAASSLLPSA